MGKSMPALVAPDNLSIPVWRYLDLPQLIDLLATKSLYFSRADQLNDDHEGSVPKANKKRRAIEEEEHYTRFHQHLREDFFINSWHMSKDESYAMWRIYSHPNTGIALQTTYRQLANSCKDKEVYISCVNYIDYLSDNLIDEDPYRYFTHKRKCFDYEKEVRLLKYIPSDNEDSLVKNSKGIKIPIKLAKLIHYIYVSPFAQDWYYQVVIAVINKFAPSLRSKLRWSTLRYPPLF